MTSMFDISVRLKPLLKAEENLPSNLSKKSKRFKSRRSKSTAFFSQKKLKKKKTIKNDKKLFEVNKNKLSVQTDKNFYEYTFKKVFDDKTENKRIYEEMIKNDLSKVLSGKWLTFMTYGTSGSGKTFTIFGDSFGEEKGIVYYACKRLFQMFREKDITYDMKCCLLEIYNEQISNLLPNNNNKVEVLENEDKNIVLQHAEKVEVNSAKQLMKLIKAGAKSRHIAENFSNKRSSRSHMIVLLELEFLYKNQMHLTKIAFLDLAGSERVVLDKKNLMLEGANINRSLLALTNCISILSEKKSTLHVPYRDSKLTRILKDFMNKNNVIKFLVCLKQEKHFVEESLITLNYAFKAQKIEKKQHLLKLQTHSKNYYKHKIQKLEKELRLLRMKSSSLEKRSRKVILTRCLDLEIVVVLIGSAIWIFKVETVYHN